MSLSLIQRENYILLLTTIKIYLKNKKIYI